MKLVLVLSAVVGITLCVWSRAGFAQEGQPVPLPQKRVNIEAVQGVLAVQSLDGWLLTGGGKARNAISTELVSPEGRTNRRWFYFIPSLGQPTVLLHKSEASAFLNVPGTKVQYAGFRDLKTRLGVVLKGSSAIAMEYAPESGIASLTRVDAGTVTMVRDLGVTIQSSATLVQYTKAFWGPKGRISHYVAVHHMNKLRAAAIQFIAERMAANQSVTEYDVQQFVANGYQVRGLQGEISVATGGNTAKPNYKPTKWRSSILLPGHLVVLDLNAVAIDQPRAIFARSTWVAYLGHTVPSRYQEIFAVVARARDSTVAFLRDSVNRRRLVRGFEAAQKARDEVTKAGYSSNFVHRTGHSLDTNLVGDGAHLDDYETHDTRNLVAGAGFTVGPGIYFEGDFGIRSVVNVYMARGGVEVTTPMQTVITTIHGAASGLTPESQDGR